jgi:hypothetical protein
MPFAARRSKASALPGRETKFSKSSVRIRLTMGTALPWRALCKTSASEVHNSKRCNRHVCAEPAKVLSLLRDSEKRVRIANQADSSGPIFSNSCYIDD